MENPFAQIEQRLDDIEDLLNTLLARMDEIEKPDTEIIGDVEECSRWIKKSPSTIYKYVSKKTIPHIKNGKKVLFNKEVIMKWPNSGVRSTLSEMQNENDHNLHNLSKARVRA